MSFKDCLRAQLTRHPSARTQDIVKQCYQAAFGAEHLLSDLSGAEHYFAEEYGDTRITEEPLYEHISQGVCRVNLGAWKRSGLPAVWLFRMFALSASAVQDGSGRFFQYLTEAEELIGEGGNGVSTAEWAAYLADYKKNGMGAVHHSREYRSRELPSYRIVSSRVLRILPVLEKIAGAYSGSGPFTLALDGRAASGKTSMAEQLGCVLGGSVIHMDDFFLPMELRTADRLAEPGGNVHYERFAGEVLPGLKTERDFSYRVFDCGKMDYSGSRVVEGRPFYIVEGSYCCHPAFGNYAQLRAFSDVNPEEQMSRLLLRNGAEAAEQFRTRWIPMEEQYFSACQITEQADIVV